MKKQVKKVIIITLVWTMVMVSAIISKTYADNQGLNLSIVTDKKIYVVGDDIEVKIKLNEKVMTASYYLNYNSSVLTYKETKTSNLAVKDYPNENLIKCVYADLSGTGIDEIIFVFNLKTETDKNILLNLTNATMTTAKDSKSYSNNEIKGIENSAQIQLEKPDKEQDKNTTIGNNTIDNDKKPTNNNIVDNNKKPINNTVKENTINSSVITNSQNKKVEDKTTSKSKLPNTGIENTYRNLLIILIIISIYLGYNVFKLNKYFKF